MRRAIGYTLALSLLLLSAVNAQPQPGNAREKLNGDYTITFRGEWTGTGTANITANTRMIVIGEAVTDAGKTVVIELKAQIVDGRIQGAGMVDGKAVVVDGRVEPGATKESARINGNISDLANRLYGRYVAARKDKDDKQDGPDDNNGKGNN